MSRKGPSGPLQSRETHVSRSDSRPRRHRQWHHVRCFRWVGFRVETRTGSRPLLVTITILSSTTVTGLEMLTPLPSPVSTRVSFFIRPFTDFGSPPFYPLRPLRLAFNFPRFDPDHECNENFKQL